METTRGSSADLTPTLEFYKDFWLWKWIETTVRFNCCGEQEEPIVGFVILELKNRCGTTH
jgi:hypothetical protein